MRGLTLIALFVVGISVPAMAQQVTVTGTPAGGAA